VPLEAQALAPQPVMGREIGMTVEPVVAPFLVGDDEQDVGLIGTGHAQIASRPDAIDADGSSTATPAIW
jgi:hypothetical protein